MDSDEEFVKNPETLPVEEKKVRKRGPASMAKKEPKLTKSGKPRAPPTENQMKALAENRSKALEKLTELRRQKREKKEEEEKIVEEIKLDRAPKVREVESGMSALRAEMEALKKEFAQSRNVKPTEEVKPPPVMKELEPKPQRKVKKIIYEDEDEDAEEIVEVVRRKTTPKPKTITGTELLDKLFFNQ